MLLVQEQRSVNLRLVLRAEVPHLRHHVLELVGLQVAVELLVDEGGVVDRHPVAALGRQAAQAAAVIKLRLVPASACLCVQLQRWSPKRAMCM